MDPDILLNALETWGYGALLLLLVLNGIGSPIPEDLVLFVAGYLVFADVFHWPATFIIAMSGVVVSDLMLYSVGRHLGRRSAGWSDGRFLSRTRLDRVGRWFARLGNGAVFVARLVPGTRALVFVIAGVRAMPVETFLRYDLLGAAVWVSTMVTVGYVSGSAIGDLDEAIGMLRQSVLWMVIAAGLVLSWTIWRRGAAKL